MATPSANSDGIPAIFHTIARHSHLIVPVSFLLLVGVLVVVGFESLARGRLLAFLGWAIIVIVGASVVVGLVQEWRLTLGVLLLVGAVVLLAQNLRELRSSR